MPCIHPGYSHYCRAGLLLAFSPDAAVGGRYSGGTSTPFLPAVLAAACIEGCDEELWFSAFINVAISFARSFNGYSDISVLCESTLQCEGRRGLGEIGGMQGVYVGEKRDVSVQCMRGTSDIFVRSE